MNTRMQSRKRVNFGKITDLNLLPNLIYVQKKSFDWFLQAEVKDPTKRANQVFGSKLQGAFFVFLDTPR